MPKKPAETTCTGCGKGLGVLKITFKSIPGGVFCRDCARRIQEQIDQKGGK